MAPVLASPLHFVLFPFMAHGHIAPLLRLARLLSIRHHIAVTFFTTPANSPAIRAHLSDAAVTVVDLPFPTNIPGIPAGVENTEKLPSRSLFVAFAAATKLMRPSFEAALKALRPPVDCIISDGFLGWTQESAEQLGIPRLVTYGVNCYSWVVYSVLARDRPHAAVHSDDEPFSLPGLPEATLTKNDVDPPFNEPYPKGEEVEFAAEHVAATARSDGMVMNSFHELEPAFHDYWNRSFGPKAWCVGPLCLAQRAKVSKNPPPPPPLDRPSWEQWLDKQLTEGNRSVLYVAFGTQAEVSPEQLREVAVGLERSKKSFLWVLRSEGCLGLLEGFEERVRDRGLIVKEWVDQAGVLEHDSVNGFLSHCGWNSVTESICAGVPILAMPIMAEQHLNARMVVEEIGAGLRAPPSNGTVRGMVMSGEVARTVVELMEGEKGKEVRKKVKQVREAAFAAMEDGGSSATALEQLISMVCRKKGKPVAESNGSMLRNM